MMPILPVPPPWVWLGGLRCEEVQLRHWLSSPRYADAVVADIRKEITDDAIDSFEQHTGLAPNPELVALAEEYWLPHVEPVAREQWGVLLEPSVLWYSERVTCAQAWALRHGRKPELDAALNSAFQVFLDERREIDGTFREQFYALLDAHEDEFEPLAKSVLPHWEPGD